MNVLLDTHVWAWSLTGGRFHDRVTEAVEAAETVFVSPVSFYEIGQKVRLGKWPEMAPYIDQLTDLATETGAYHAHFSPEVAHLAALMDWAHRDPFDRMLAATALDGGLAFVSADRVFDGVVERVW